MPSKDQFVTKKRKVRDVISVTKNMEELNDKIRDLDVKYTDRIKELEERIETLEESLNVLKTENKKFQEEEKESLNILKTENERLLKEKKEESIWKSFMQTISLLYHKAIVPFSKSCYKNLKFLVSRLSKIWSSLNIKVKISAISLILVSVLVVYYKPWKFTNSKSKPDNTKKVTEKKEKKKREGRIIDFSKEEKNANYNPEKNYIKKDYVPKSIDYSDYQPGDNSDKRGKVYYRGRWVTPEERAELASKLGSDSGKGDPLEYWISKTKSNNPKDRAKAAEELAKIGTHRAGFNIEKLLKDKDDGVKWKAIRAITKMKYKFALDELKRIAKDSGEPVTTRSESISAMGYIEARAAIPFLISMLRDKGEKEELRATAAEALALMNATSALAVFFNSLDDKSNLVRSSCIASLGMLRYPRAVPKLIEIIKTDKDIPVRTAAAEALGKITLSASKSIPFLLEYVEKDLDYDIMRKIYNSLKNLSPYASSNLKKQVEEALVKYKGKF